MPMKNSLILLFIVLSSKILLAQTPYKYDPNASNGVGALNDLNWETTTPAFFDDMGDNTNSLNLWLYRSPDGQYLTEGVFFAVGGTLNDQDNYANWDNNLNSNYSYSGLSHSLGTNNNINFHKLRLDLMRNANNAPQPRTTFYTTWATNGRLIKHEPPYKHKWDNITNQWVPTTNPPESLDHKFIPQLW